MTKSHTERVSVVVSSEMEKLLHHLENSEPDDCDLRRLKCLLEIDMMVGNHIPA